MSFHGKGRWKAAPEACRYGVSKLAVRGPKRSLTNEYVAFLGGTETYGKFVARPFAQGIEAATGVACVNLGQPNAGIDVMLGDTGLTRIASGAAAAVVQVPCAANLSNPFYKVHSRRNDRFLRAEPPLRALFPEVDFSEFSFTRHMLMHLKAVSPERFGQLRLELARAWETGMRMLIAGIRAPVILLWFSERAPDRDEDAVEARCEPVLVGREMVAGLQRHAVAFVEAGKVAQVGARVASPPSDAAGDEAGVPRDLPGQAAHDAVAEALIPVLAGVLDP
ncbi:hypothetical protein FIU89_16680 [Roseovarius sp. THAF27]|nr:hypothetical protein FIU89_16680 [Roseovarius sp. THAF27]